MRPVRRGGEGSFGVLLIEVQDAVCEVDGGVAGEEGDLGGGPRRRSRRTGGFL